MMQPTFLAQRASVPSTPTLHLPDVVRGVMVLAGVGVLAKITVLNEHVILSLVAWIALIGYVGLALVAGARIAFVDAAAAAQPFVRVERTRQIGVFKELVTAGLGSLLLLSPVACLALTTSQEVWAGRVQEASPSLGGLVVASLVGVLGFFMTFWRPQFVVDIAARKIVRYPFGRSLPLRAKELPYAELAVYADGYFITNTGVRLGDMIRARVGKYTFEIEMLRGRFAAEHVQAHVVRWASTLGARSMTPEQAAAAELGI